MRLVRVSWLHVQIASWNHSRYSKSWRLTHPGNGIGVSGACTLLPEGRNKVPFSRSSPIY